MARVLVISPHPDDEAIGCGGTICKHVAAGDEVHVIVLTAGEKGGHGRDEAETVRIRRAEADAAAGILGVRPYEFWAEPDGNVRPDDRVVSKLVEVLRVNAFAIVYAPHDDEMHPDHRAAAQIVRAACDQCDRKPRLLFYEVWTPLGKMDVIEVVTAFIDTKVAAIQAYRCQNDVLAFDEAFRGLARYRGEMFSWPSGEYAEVFREAKR